MDQLNIYALSLIHSIGLFPPFTYTSHGFSCARILEVCTCVHRVLRFLSWWQRKRQCTLLLLYTFGAAGSVELQ